MTSHMTFSKERTHCIKGTLEHSTGSPLKTGCHVLQLAGYGVLDVVYAATRG